jgi:hypothetical protein
MQHKLLFNEALDKNANMKGVCLAVSLWKKKKKNPIFEKSGYGVVAECHRNISCMSPLLV